MFSLDKQIESVKREQKRRKRVFPYLIETKKLTEEQAISEIAVMQSVYETLTSLRGLLKD